MVKVLFTGPITDSPRQVAFGRLQEMNATRGAYHYAPALTSTADAVSFGQKVQKQAPEQINPTSRWNRVTEAVKQSAKAGTIVAATILGGILGGGLPGMLIAGFGTAAVMALLNLRRMDKVTDASPAESVDNHTLHAPDSLPKDGSTNPFMAIDLADIGGKDNATAAAVGSSARTMARERLLAAMVDHSIEIGAAETEAAVVAEKPKFGRTNSTYKTMVPGMMPTGYTPFSGEAPTLRFKATKQVRTSALKNIRPEAAFLGTATHNITKPLAVVTLGVDSSNVNVFQPGNQPPISKTNEKIVFSGGQSN